MSVWRHRSQPKGRSLTCVLDIVQHIFCVCVCFVLLMKRNQLICEVSFVLYGSLFKSSPFHLMKRKRIYVYTQGHRDTIQHFFCVFSERNSMRNNNNGEQSITVTKKHFYFFSMGTWNIFLMLCVWQDNGFFFQNLPLYIHWILNIISAPLLILCRFFFLFSVFFLFCPLMSLLWILWQI